MNQGPNKELLDGRESLDIYEAGSSTFKYNPLMKYYRLVSDNRLMFRKGFVSFYYSDAKPFFITSNILDILTRIMRNVLISTRLSQDG